jgi:hypothetical protein
VLTRDVRFEGWTTETWSRFLHLWKPRAPADRELTRPRGGVFALHEGGRLRKLLHTRTGRIDPRGTKWPAPLGGVCEQHQAAWALSGHVGALEEVMERFGARARRNDDLVAQSLSLVQIVREMTLEGALETWPRRLRGIPPPADAMVRRAVDTLCADGHAIALGMFKDGELWTAFVARRRGANFDVIAGPDELQHHLGLLAGDWRRDYRHVVRAVEELYAPLSFGCFAEVDTFRALQVDARPGAWGRAVAVRDVILSPIPTAIGLALGVDGARYAFEGLKRLLPSGRGRRVAPLALLEPVLASMRARLGTAAGERDVSHVLGFDPMHALRQLLRR